MNITLQDLIGTWRSEIDEDHYFDLTFRENETYLFDEIINNEKIGRCVKSNFNINEEPKLYLENIDYKLFMVDFERKYIVFKDKNGFKIIFDKIR